MDDRRRREKVVNEQCLLPARRRTVPRTADRHSFQQGPAGHHEIAFMQVIAQATIEEKAIRIDPNRDGRDFRIETVHDP